MTFMTLAILSYPHDPFSAGFRPFLFACQIPGARFWVGHHQKLGVKLPSFATQKITAKRKSDGMHSLLRFLISYPALKLSLPNRLPCFCKLVDEFTHRDLVCARILLAAIWSVVCVLIIAAPALLAGGHERTAGIIYFCFTPLCHRLPDRCFNLAGHTWAVCHRCSGIYFGLLVATVVDSPWNRLLRKHSRLGIILGLMPLVFDALMNLAGLWRSNGATRFLTGMVFGTTTSSLLVFGLAELLHSLGRRVRPSVLFKS